MGKQKVYLEKLLRFFQIRNLLIRQGLAECLGTLILVVRMRLVFVFIKIYQNTQKSVNIMCMYKI